MKFLCLIILLGSVFSSYSFAKSEFPDLTCMALPSQLTDLNGKNSKITVYVSVSPQTEIQRGFAELSALNPDGTLNFAFTQLLVASKNTNGSWKYEGSQVKLETDPRSCNAEKQTCHVTMTVNHGASVALGTGDCRATTNVLTLPEAIELTLKKHPEVEAARKSLAAAEAGRGQLWERFMPVLSFSVMRQNMDGSGGLYSINPLSITTISSQIGLSPTLMNYFSWKGDSLGVKSSREQLRLVENQLAMRTVEAYSTVVTGQSLLKALQTTFLKTLNKLKASQKPGSQLEGMFSGLIANIKTMIISQKYALKSAYDQFRLLTGVNLENSELSLSNESIYSNYIPLLPSQETAAELMRAQNPILRLGKYAVEIRKNDLNMTRWSPLGASVGYGPSKSWIALPPPIQTLNSYSANNSLGISVNVDPLAYRRQTKAAKLHYQTQLENLKSQKLSIEGIIDQDFFRFQQQIETICTQRPEYLKVVSDFKKLVDIIEAEGEYDPVAAATSIPQALSSVEQCYTAQMSAVASIADIHAQIGDLSKPATWDPTPNTVDLCQKYNGFLKVEE